MPDVVAPETHQNNRSYVRQLSGPTFDSLRKNLAWWAVTWRTSKNHKTCQNWGVGACMEMGTCTGQYGKCIFTFLSVGLSTVTKDSISFIIQLIFLQQYFPIPVIFISHDITWDVVS